MQVVDVDGVKIGDEYPTRVAGVLNFSPESQHHNSRNSTLDEAVNHIESVLVPEGADIVEIGLRSTSARGDVSVATELERLENAVDVVKRADVDVKYSIETRHSSVADEALHRGFDMVNDVCGFADPEMHDVCAAHDAAVVKMASGDSLERPGWIQGIDTAIEELAKGGVTDKTILDPGFGGWFPEKQVEDDQERFQRLREFRELNQPLSVAVERKEFITDLARSPTTNPRSASLSAVATAIAVERGAHIIRAHDVAEARAAIAVAAPGEKLDSTQKQSNYQPHS